MPVFTEKKNIPHVWAKIKDFAATSGLNGARAKAAVNLLKSEMEELINKAEPVAEEKSAAWAEVLRAVEAAEEAGSLSLSEV